MAREVRFFFSCETVTTDFFAFSSRDITDLVPVELATPAFLGHRAPLLRLRLGGVAMTMFVGAIGRGGGDNMHRTSSLDTAPTGRGIDAMAGTLCGVVRQCKIQGDQTKRYSTQH